MARAIGTRAIAAIDRLAPDEARGILDLAQDRDWGPEAMLHLRGPRALLATLEGRHDEAVRLRTVSAETSPESERPRCLGDLADVLRRVGDLAAAAGAIDEALRLAGEVRRRRAYQHLTSPYLLLHEARVLHAMGDDAAALEVIHERPATVGPDPGLRFRLLEAEIRGDLSMVEARFNALPKGLRSATVMQALFDRTRGRLGDEAAQARLIGWPVFEGCGFDEAARRLPY